MKKIIVLGGGPAGMMAAYTAASNGAETLLIEQNEILGRKLLITGKGRCNVTNFSSEEELIGQIVNNRKFLYSAFNAFNAYDAYGFFEENGVPLKVERGNRVFPVSDRAADVRNAMKNAMLQAGVKIICDQIKSIDGKKLMLQGKYGDYCADSIIIATGGCSYPLTGSKGDGYRFAKSLGHNVINPRPALVPLIEKGFNCERMMGLSLKNVRLSVCNCKGKKLYENFGEMLFTHCGISGPLVLSVSSLLRDGDFPARAIIDLKPALDEETLDRRLLKDFDLNSNKDFANALDRLLPRKLIPIVIERSGIDTRIKVHQITKEQRKKLALIIKNFEILIAGKSGFDEAIVTAGGVDIGQIDPRTMESKLVPDVYFAGEVLDVDAFTGGYNLQIAYSTGYLAGISAAQK